MSLTPRGFHLSAARIPTLTASNFTTGNSIRVRQLPGARSEGTASIWLAVGVAHWAHKVGFPYHAQPTKYQLNKSHCSKRLFATAVQSMAVIGQPATREQVLVCFPDDSLAGKQLGVTQSRSWDSVQTYTVQASSHVPKLWTCHLAQSCGQL